MKKWLDIAALGFSFYFMSRFVTIFIMPPTAPVTEGATRIMWKNEQLGFLATPTSICKDKPVNQTLCQGGVMAYYRDNDDNIMTLPYFQPLHWLASV